MAKGQDYTVESKTEARSLDRSGAVVTSYRIWATSKGGTYFHIDVAESELAQADARLTAKAKQLDGI